MREKMKQFQDGKSDILLKLDDIKLFTVISQDENDVTLAINAFKK